MSGINIESAVELYYRCTELGIKEIEQIFGCKESKARSFKVIAHEQMVKDGVKVWNARNVDTESAYKAWGIDVPALEKRLTHLHRIQDKGVISNA